MKALGQLSDGEMQHALREVDRYKTLHQERPGFFDTAINAGRPNKEGEADQETYFYL